MVKRCDRCKVAFDDRVSFCPYCCSPSVDDTRTLDELVAVGYRAFHGGRSAALSQEVPVPSSAPTAHIEEDEDERLRRGYEDFVLREQQGSTSVAGSKDEMGATSAQWLDPRLHPLASSESAADQNCHESDADHVDRLMTGLGLGMSPEASPGVVSSQEIVRESGTSIQPIAGQGAANPDYDLVFSDIRVEHERPKHELAEFVRDDASSRFFRDLFVPGTVLNRIGSALLLVVGIWLTIVLVVPLMVGMAINAFEALLPPLLCIGFLWYLMRGIFRR